MSEFSTKINQITYEERVSDMIGELSCHDHEKIVRHHLGVCYELYEKLEATKTRLGTKCSEKDRLLAMCWVTGHRDGWQDGPTNAETFDAVNTELFNEYGVDWLNHFEREKEGTA